MDTSAPAPYKEFTGPAERIMRLLGQGIEAHRVASAIGVDPSYISQLLADEDFAAKVQELRFAHLTEATDRDRRYDRLEDKLITKIESDIDSNPFAFKSTNDKMRALVMANSLKRRGAAADTSVTHNNATVVQLIMPTVLMNKFVTDARNQIVQAGDKHLITMQSKSLEEIANESISNGSQPGAKSQITFYE